MPIIKSIRKDYSRSENQKVSYDPPLKITGGDKVYTAGGYTVHLFLKEGDHQLKVETIPEYREGMTNLVN
jgi:hypothetical protein